MKIYIQDAVEDEISKVIEKAPEEVQEIFKRWYVKEGEHLKDLSIYGDLHNPQLILTHDEKADEWEIYLAGELCGGRKAWTELGFSEADMEKLKEFVKETDGEFKFNLPVVFEFSDTDLGAFCCYGAEALNFAAKKIKEYELGIIKEHAQAYADADCCCNYSNGFNSDFVSISEDGYFYYLRDEYGDGFVEENEDIVQELLSNFRVEFMEVLKEKAKRIVEEKFDDGYKTVGLVLGVQHNTIPYKYYPEYQVLSERALGEADLKEVLEENGVAPHAWGVTANYNNWGNYWFIVLTPENYKEEIEDNLDVALAVLSNYPERFLDLDKELNKTKETKIPDLKTGENKGFDIGR